MLTQQKLQTYIRCKNQISRATQSPRAHAPRNNNAAHVYTSHVSAPTSSYPDPALCEGKGLVTIERFLGSCRISSPEIETTNQNLAARAISQLTLRNRR